MTFLSLSLAELRNYDDRGRFTIGYLLTTELEKRKTFEIRCFFL